MDIRETIVGDEPISSENFLKLALSFFIQGSDEEEELRALLANNEPIPAETCMNLLNWRKCEENTDQLERILPEFCCTVCNEFGSLNKCKVDPNYYYACESKFCENCARTCEKCDSACSSRCLELCDYCRKYAGCCCYDQCASLCGDCAGEFGI